MVVENIEVAGHLGDLREHLDLMRHDLGAGGLPQAQSDWRDGGEFARNGGVS
jgi:hypothetical protein